MSDEAKKQAPEQMRQAVIYRPDLFGDSIYVKSSDYKTGARLEPLLESFQRKLPGYDETVHYHEDKPGLLFRSTDPEAHAWLLDYFDIVREASAAVGIVHPKVLGSRRDDEGKSRLRYPFHTLMNIGDHFFVEGGDRQTVSTYATNYKRYVVPDKIIKCCAVPGGILVILVYAPGISLGEKVSP